MKPSILLLIVVVLFGIVFSACSSPEDKVLPYPNCIQAAIDSILALPLLDPPGKIEQWICEGDPYYYISGGCCDFFNYLYDADCQRVCAPDGGITGNGDGSCPNFTGEIIKITAWEDAP